MEADYGKDCTKFEKRENLSVPPGFTSLTSFILKRGGNVKKKPIFMETIPEMNDITAYRQVLMHRPWIISDQSNHRKPEESHTYGIFFFSILQEWKRINEITKQGACIGQDPSLNAGRPKGAIHGCPNCSNCVKVTARWHPRDAIRGVLEEAPIFHPTEEEFKDTLKYIASIRSKAEPYGICRIVPPTCWKSPCSLEKKNLWEKSEFVAQIQRIDGHQVQNAQETTASARGNTKTKRKGDVKVALDSQLGIETPAFQIPRMLKNVTVSLNLVLHSVSKHLRNMQTYLRASTSWEPSVKNIEGEYGRIVQNPTEEIKVLRINTLEAGVFSSGFSTLSDPVEACTYPEYLKSGWNMNNILSLSGSLLCFESSEASRNFAPKIHVGMCFSPLNWKVEEHHLYSLSYMHLGEPKVWYGIPGRFAANFETIWKKYLPDLHAG
ncbi:Lysine-specific demethylase JMJ703 [Glycine soja]